MREKEYEIGLYKRDMNVKHEKGIFKDRENLIEFFLYFVFRNQN